jgi:hypothetical protein
MNAHDFRRLGEALSVPSQPLNSVDDEAVRLWRAFQQASTEQQGALFLQIMRQCSQRERNLAAITLQA